MDIIVLGGGLCMERDVSLKSAAMICSALRRKGHRAVCVDPFFGYEGDPDKLFEKQEGTGAEIGSGVPDLEKVRSMRRQQNSSRIADGLMDTLRRADLVFLGLHGGDGEDGRLQAALDIAGIKYTGSGYLGSAIAMNKEAAKNLFIASGIRTPEGKKINLNDSDKSTAWLPCVVKPKSSGSSVGTSIAHNEAEYAAALDFAFKYEDDVLVEKYIKGREVDVGVLDGTALPSIEIIPKSGFFDYKNKYQDGMTSEICPADFPPETEAALRRAAEQVFRALYLKVYARMDFIVEEGTGLIYCLEANTLPGMTPASLLPKEAAAAGIGYDELCQKIVELSLEK
ncbi:MAG: D-alanine--D-alanine ligase [Oscillospiraceae bacterium]|nr:D-alanine--D-alanine ligase [Oscillospiraceae bacterium]